MRFYQSRIKTKKNPQFELLDPCKTTMFDSGDTMALLIILTLTAVGLLACLGAYARRRSYIEAL